MSVDPAHLRMLEALLFAASEPLDRNTLQTRLPNDADVESLVDALTEEYAPRGVNVVQRDNKYLLQTAPDLAFLLRREVEQTRRLSRAAIETLAIIAYHQPVTRAEIEEIRGVQVSKGTLDVLMETGWVRIKGTLPVPGRPTTYAVTEDFLVHFGLESLKDLPGIEELRAAGLLDSDLPDGFKVNVGEPGTSADDEEGSPLGQKSLFGEDDEDMGDMIEQDDAADADSSLEKD